MYKFCANPKTEKGATQLILAKRNKQFSSLFKKLRDPINILEFYLVIGKVYKKHFRDEDKAVQWTKVLMFVADKGFFWQSDLKDKMGLNPKEADSVLKKMGRRHLLNVDKSKQLYLYSLTADGHLFLKNFSKECMSAMMEVVRNSRNGNKRITSTLKKKKNVQQQ